MADTAEATAAISAPTEVPTTFTHNNTLWGVARDGRVYKMDRNRITWVDTGLQLT